MHRDLAPKGPAGQETQTSELSQAFTDANHAVLKLTANPAFHQTCLEAGIDPYDDMNTERYWDTFTQCASEGVARARAGGNNSLRVQAFDLLASTPQYLYKQASLGNGGRMTSKEDVAIASAFNGHIRDFAVNNPDTSVSQLTNALLQVTSMAMEDKTVRASAADILHATIRGAQHELAFGQILAHTGREYRPASIDEDLHGADYMVAGSRGQTLRVDVKASLADIQKQGQVESPYVHSNNGRIIMYSLTKDSEFHDHFFTGDDVAADKAVVLDTLLTAAEQQNTTTYSSLGRVAIHK